MIKWNFINKGSIGLLKKIVNICMAIWFLFFMFNGVIRFYFTKYGLTYLIYLSNLSLITIVLIYLIKVIKELKIQKQIFIFLIFVFFGIVIGFLNELKAQQVLFSLNIYLPFLAGFIYSYYYKTSYSVLINIYRIFTPIALLGIFMDYFYELPWQGYEYEIGDFSIEASRYWTTFGIERLAGFQRSSVESGILIFMLLTINLTIRLYTKLKASAFLRCYDFILNFLGICGIYFTTFKTGFLSIILLNILWLLIIIYRNISWYKGKIICRIIIKFQMLLLFIYLIIPPLISLSGVKFSDIKDEYLRILFTSYAIRLEEMWPNAFELLEHSNFTFFGRGAGGIGVAQKYFEASLYNPGDNFFVYIFVSFGVISLIIMLYLIIKIFTIDIDNQHNLFLLISLFIIFSFGATVNVVESGGLMVIIAVLLANYKKNKFQKLQIKT